MQSICKIIFILQFSLKLEEVLSFTNCPHPMRQKFDEVKNGCVGIIDATEGCNPEFGNAECEENAYCGEDNRCHCSPGYSSTREWLPTCLLHYGEACEPTGVKCNPDRGLTCQDGICRCQWEPDYIFNPDMTRCVITEGNLCIRADNFDLAYKRQLVCGPGLECKLTATVSNSYFGICTPTS